MALPLRNDTKKICCCTQLDAPLIDDYRAGDKKCSECGLIVQEGVSDIIPDWRTFYNGKSADELFDFNCLKDLKDPLLNGPDLSTSIGSGTASFDVCEKSKFKSRKTIRRLEKRLKIACREINAMADRINLPKAIVDKANNLFKQVHDGKNLKGRTVDAIASACLYIACRQEGVPRTFKEICAVGKISIKEIGRCFKLILKALETSVDLITTEDFMSRFCSNLGLPFTIQKTATHIAKKAVEKDYVFGRSPISVTAAAIYMASQVSEHKRSSKEIGDVAGIAEVTIKRPYKLMIPHAAELFPPDFEFAMPIGNLPIL